MSHARLFPAARQDKPWGHELIFAEGEAGYVGKVITVRAGAALSLQYHDAKVETICVLSGTAAVEHGPDERQLTEVTLTAGEVIHLPAGVLHRITGVTDVVFVEASTAGDGWRTDVVRLADSYGRVGTSAP